MAFIGNISSNPSSKIHDSSGQDSGPRVGVQLRLSTLCQAVEKTRSGRKVLVDDVSVSLGCVCVCGQVRHRISLTLGESFTRRLVPVSTFAIAQRWSAAEG